ncbi:MAG: transaldolase [Cyanobacteria bacterium J06635_11]
MAMPTTQSTPPETQKKESPRKSQTPVKALHEYRQSVWLDYIQRCMIRSGELLRLIEEDGIRGVTSNPAIFQKAIASTTDYDKLLSTLSLGADQDALALYEQLAIEDIKAAADILKPLYESSHYKDGYVSLEVSPYLADDGEQTLEEARRLWYEVKRPNLMVKVPATPAGIPVIEQLISEGINVNVTLLFSQSAYLEVAEAYVSGLESFANAGGDVKKVASVASFFISRIDTAVDTMIAKKLQTIKEKAIEGDDTKENHEASARLKSLQGKVAIANAKLVYQEYLKLCESSRWQALAKQGAQPQRLLWASTGTKNPQYSDVLYMEALIGPNTVNTTPPHTLSAFIDHGQPSVSLTTDIDSAKAVMANLSAAEIDFSFVTNKLLREGIQIFQQAFDQLLEAVEQKVKN